MDAWKYTNNKRDVVISGDGCRSCLASALPKGTPIAEPDPMPAQDMRAMFKAAVREHLQAGCDAWDYDDIKTATGYANSRVAKWREDTAMFTAWRDDVVLAAYAIEEAIMGGSPVPSVEDFRAMLPPLPKAKA